MENVKWVLVNGENVVVWYGVPYSENTKSIEIEKGILDFNQFDSSYIMMDIEVYGNLFQKEV